MRRCSNGRAGVRPRSPGFYRIVSLNGAPHARHEDPVVHNLAHHGHEKIIQQGRVEFGSKRHMPFRFRRSERGLAQLLLVLKRCMRFHR